MSVDGPRTSVFTFQSSVHNVHVLRSLDEQRQKDVLCDVTVEVECRSFRAHRSVLACCSDYFYTRLRNNTGWNLVISLPDEVTAEGFLPLLQFAYTAKLHFTKDNILEIHRCAELLGFHNLDKACFEFLIPKFSDGSGNTQEAKRKSKNGNKSKACHEKTSAANGDYSTTSEHHSNTETHSVPQVLGVGMVPSLPAKTDSGPQVPEVDMAPSVLAETDRVPQVPKVGMAPSVLAETDSRLQVPKVGLVPSVLAETDCVPQLPEVGMAPSVLAETDKVPQLLGVGMVPSVLAETDCVPQVPEVGMAPSVLAETDSRLQVPKVGLVPSVLAETDCVPQVPEVGMAPSVPVETDKVPQLLGVGMVPSVLAETDRVPQVPKVGMAPSVLAETNSRLQVPKVGLVPSVLAETDCVPQVPKVGMAPSVPVETDKVPQVPGVGTVPSLRAETDSVPQVPEVGTVPNVPAEADRVPQIPVVDTVPSVQCPEECQAVSSNNNLPLDAPTISFQTGSGQDRTELCLQNCGPQLQQSSSVPASEVCPFLSVTCISDDKNVHPTTAGYDGDILEMGEAFQNGLSMDVALDVPSETSARETLNMPNLTEGHFNQPVRVLESSAECSQLRPLSSTETSEVLDSIASVTNLESINSEAPQTFDSDEQIFPDPANSDGSTERSTVEREVAEHLAKGFWPDLSSSLAEPLESMEQAAVGNGADFHWLKHLDLGAAPDDCPFLRDLSSKEGQPSGGDSLSKEESRESCWMSPVNSGENSEYDTDTEEDSPAAGEQVCEVELPFPVEHIPSMSRRAFLQMLKGQRLTSEQLEFVQDVRRRSKNRMAARRCRKRKLDCIYKLEGDIKKLRTQKEKLLQERSQLKQDMEEMQQSVSGLCQIACPEASVQPEQLTILARYLSSDCPTSLPFTPMACPGLAASDQDDLPDTCLEASVTGQSPNDCPQGNRAGTKPTSALFQDDTQSDVTEPHAP